MFTADSIATKIRESETLGGNPMKVTPQRRLIFKALEGKTSHPTADDIYQEVRSVIPDISVATVYKTLNELVKLGLILEIKHDGEQSRFDPRTDQHSHLACLGTKVNSKGKAIACGRLEDIALDISNLQIPDTQKQGFTIINHEVIFYGYCPDCQQNRKK